MDLSAALQAVLTSVGVSAAVTFLIQTYFSKRLEHNFARRLEAYKAELAIQIQSEHGIVTRRLEAYPKIVELCYRTRNMARDLTAPPYSNALVQEMQARARELEDYVFRFRIDLEADGVFVIVHRHKNLALNFARMITEIIANNVSDATVNLNDLYSTLEDSYQQVVGRLSEEGIYHRQ